MQQATTTIATVPVQSGVVTTPQSQRIPGLNIPVICRLGITQIVFGTLSFIFGIVLPATFSKYVWVNTTGSGIWFGIWILITGIIGFFSSRKPEVGTLNNMNLGFNITCTVVSFFVAISYAIGLAYYNNCEEYYYRYNYNYNYWYNYGSYDIVKYINYNCQHKSAAIALYAILMVLMIAEFFVSLVISIYYCKVTGCCAAQSLGVITQQQPVSFVPTSGGQMIVTSNTGYPTNTAYPPQVIMSTYPPASGAPLPTYQQTMYQQNQTSQQGMIVQAPMGGNTITTTNSGGLVPHKQNTAP